jgi:homoserine O-acetyltransferase/O-succinyltransferase
MSPLQAAGWEERVFSCDSFNLECGERLAPLRLSYAAIGAWRPDGRNTVVLLPSASGLKQWALTHVGAEETFDPERYFIVSVDALGGGDSSRPSESLGSRFPQYSIRDNARAIHLLITQGLALPALKAVGGASMGAMIALEFALCFPAFAERLFLWSPSTKCSPMFIALARLVREIVALDPVFNGGRYSRQPLQGLQAAGSAYFLALVGRRFLENTPIADRESIATMVGQMYRQCWDANDLLSRYHSLTLHDVHRRPEGNDPDILARLRSACLLMPSRSDHLLPIEEVLELHSSIPRSRLETIEGEAGHWAASQPRGTQEYWRVRDATKAFLDAAQ